MDKIIQFSGKSDKGIFTYVIDTEKSFLEKTAAEYHPTIASYINAAKPINGKTQILLTALGAGEWWGSNVNGDYFPETALAHEGYDYGYKTFEKFARVYKHHVNKPTSESYGEVLLSVYNPIFHRVELVVTFNHSNASDLVRRIDSGETVEFSMGCRVPFDICNICGNKAPTRAQYCEHAKYYMGRIHPPTGKQVHVINTMPKFFDISVVLIGADRIAKSLKKVASSYFGNIPILGSAYLAEKAAESKKAEIEKEVPANQPPASQDKVETLKNLARSISEVKAMEPPMPEPFLDDLTTRYPLAKILSTMTMMGIVPKPQEFQRMFLMGNGHKDLANDLSKHNLCFDPMSVEEPTEEHYNSIGLGSHNFDDLIMQKLLPFMADRSYAAPHLGRRIVIMIKSGTDYKLPQFIKLGKEERSPLSPALVLLAAAGAYIALARKAPKEALQGVDKILGSTAGLGLATALGLGLIKTFNRTTGPRLMGQFSSNNSTSNPDANDVFSRIEEMKQKPFNKVGSISMQGMNSAAKRLFLGVPLAYMASGVLQKHKEISPYDEEGRIRSFIRRNPDVISAALVADAVLSAHNHPLSTRSLIGGLNKAKKGFGGFAKAAMIADDLYGTDFSKTADAQDFLSQSLVWPLAMGKANLPSRMIGGLFDQAVIEGGSQLLKKRREKSN
jgi:hypothetical protein